MQQFGHIAGERDIAELAHIRRQLGSQTDFFIVDIHAWIVTPGWDRVGLFSYNDSQSVNILLRFWNEPISIVILPPVKRVGRRLLSNIALAVIVHFDKVLIIRRKKKESPGIPDDTSSRLWQNKARAHYTNQRVPYLYAQTVLNIYPQVSGTASN
jgi:hypothetical protein